MRRSGGGWSPEPELGTANRDGFGLLELASELDERGGGPSECGPAGRRGDCPDSFESTDDTDPERDGTPDSLEPTDDTDAGPRCDCPATIFESGIERDDVWIPLLGGCDTEPSFPGDGRVVGGPPAGPSLARLITDEPRLSTDAFDDAPLDDGGPSEADELPLLPE